MTINATKILDTRAILKGNLPCILAQYKEEEYWLLGMNDETKATISGIGAITMPLNLSKYEFSDQKMFVSKFEECRTRRESVSFFYVHGDYKWLCVITPIYITKSLQYFVLYTVQMAAKGNRLLETPMDTFANNKVKEKLNLVDNFLEVHYGGKQQPTI